MDNFLTSALVGSEWSPLYPRYPLDRRLVGLQRRSGRHGEENILDTTGTRTPAPRPSSP
jgi:hypothetical protein